jgi:hypothetical protein
MRNFRLGCISIIVCSLSLGFWVSPTQASQNFCPDLVLVGARGSGERTPHQLPSNAGKYIDVNSPAQVRSYKAWLGQTIGSVYTELITMKNTPFVPFNPENTNQKALGKTSISWISYGVFVDKTIYPAAEVPTNFFKREETRKYLGEVTTENTGLLKVSLREHSSRCPNSKFLLVGYSQGAAIIRLAVSNLSPTADLDITQKIAGVVLIADPLLSPKDDRLAVDKDARWTGTTASCGSLRLLATTTPECFFSPESAIISFVLKAIQGNYILYECVKKGGCENSSAVDVNLAAIVKPAFTTPEISRNTGVKEILSVCYVGDLVCSVFGKRNNLAWASTSVNNPVKIHTDYYKKSSVSASIARWIEKRVPPTPVKSPIDDSGKKIIEDWLGKGWIGSESSCKSILKIANTATKTQLKDWIFWKGMRVIALNPSTGTLLTVAASPESGDPHTVITGSTKSTKGKWTGFDNFWDMFEASSEFWATYDLSYSSDKFICETRSD